jgi:hypothetical protein
MNAEAQAAFDKLYDEVYCHWLDCHESRDTLEEAFDAGQQIYRDWTDYMAGDRHDYEDPDYLDCVFDHGVDWRIAFDEGRGDEYLADQCKND